MTKHFLTPKQREAILSLELECPESLLKPVRGKGEGTNWETPPPSDVRKIAAASDLVGHELAVLTGTDGRTVRRYQSDPTTKGYTKIPYLVFKELALAAADHIISER